MHCTRRRRIPFALGTVVGGLLAVGFATGLASADSSADPFSWSDELLSGLSVPAQTSALDIQVSIDGMDLFSTVGNTATATSGTGDIAIAIGNGADADAFGGSGNVAFADGADSVAMAGGSYTYPFPLFGAEYFTFPDNFDLAYVVGDGSTAIAGGEQTFSNFDLAGAVGDALYASAIDGNYLTDIVPSA
jgi:prepilin-type processing-associated H-X9-DG protein